VRNPSFLSLSPSLATQNPLLGSPGSPIPHPTFTPQSLLPPGTQLYHDLRPLHGDPVSLEQGSSPRSCWESCAEEWVPGSQLLSFCSCRAASSQSLPAWSLLMEAHSPARGGQARNTGCGQGSKPASVKSRVRGRRSSSTFPNNGMWLVQTSVLLLC